MKGMSKRAAFVSLFLLQWCAHSRCEIRRAVRQKQWRAAASQWVGNAKAERRLLGFLGPVKLVLLLFFRDWNYMTLFQFFLATHRLKGSDGTIIHTTERAEPNGLPILQAKRAHYTYRQCACNTQTRKMDVWSLLFLSVVRRNWIQLNLNNSMASEFSIIAPDRWVFRITEKCWWYESNGAILINSPFLTSWLVSSGAISIC